MLRKIVAGLPRTRVVTATDDYLHAECAIALFGFVDDIVPRDELMQSALEMAGTVAGLAPLAVQGMKATLNGIANGTLDEAAANQHIKQCWASNDHREGLAAKSEKRRPNFKGN